MVALFYGVKIIYIYIFVTKYYVFDKFLKSVKSFANVNHCFLINFNVF